MCSVRKFLWLFLLLPLLASCGDNLFPSGEDKRPTVVAGTTGPAVGQNAPDFSVSDSTGATVTLASALTGRKGIVLYFTMWCPICDSHMSHMRDTTISRYPNVTFYAVDYVSGSVADARSNQASYGYVDNGFTVLADIKHTVQTAYQGTMGTTVVIDNSGVVRMNEDYKDGSRLTAVLAALP